MATFHPLWQAFLQALGGPPGDLAFAVRSLPDVGHLPSPWATWTRTGLVRHRHRQLRVAEVVRTRLGGDLAAIATLGAFGHPPGSVFDRLLAKYDRGERDGKTLQLLGIAPEAR